MVSSYYYNGNEYQQRSNGAAQTGLLAATLASSAILSPLALVGKPFQKQLLIEHGQNELYKDAFEKGFDISGLKEKGVSIKLAQNLDKNTPEKLGLNAYFDTFEKKICLNTDKISIAGFHEMGHAINQLGGKFGSKLGKLLHGTRNIGYIIAGLMEYYALFSRKKPKEAPRNINDFIEDNCGKIAFVAMMPLVAEEAMASYNGIKLAKQSGLSGTLVKNMKNLYRKALYTYIGRAALGGLAIGASRIIMDKFTRPKKIERDNIDILFG